MKEIENVVFEGGGIKGAAYGGVLEALETLGILQNIKKCAGASAGAITATLVSLKFDTEEIIRILSDTNFASFADDSWGVVRDVGRLLTQYGWHKGIKFTEWMGSIIKSRTGKTFATFKDLKDNGFLDLYIVGSNLTKQSVDIFSYETTPNMMVKDAAHISMAIPLYFQCVRNEKNEVLVDGGTTCNYPIRIFDDEGKTNPKTLGFRLDTHSQIEYSRDWGSPPKEIKNILDYVEALISFMMDAIDKKHLTKADWERTIFIDTKGVKATDFDLPKEKIKELYENGKESTLKYFGKQ